MVRVLARLYYPDIAAILSLPFILVLLLYQFGSGLVVFSETLVLWVFEARFDVECQWKIVEGIRSYFLVVFSQVIEQCFFVSQIKIILQVIVYQGFHAVIAFI